MPIFDFGSNANVNMVVLGASIVNLQVQDGATATFYNYASIKEGETGLTHIKLNVGVYRLSLDPAAGSDDVDIFLSPFRPNFLN